MNEIRRQIFNFEEKFIYNEKISLRYLICVLCSGFVFLLQIFTQMRSIQSSPSHHSNSILKI